MSEHPPKSTVFDNSLSLMYQSVPVEQSLSLRSGLRLDFLSHFRGETNEKSATNLVLRQMENFLGRGESVWVLNGFSGEMWHIKTDSKNGISFAQISTSSISSGSSEINEICIARPRLSGSFVQNGDRKDFRLTLTSKQFSQGHHFEKERLSISSKKEIYMRNAFIISSKNHPLLVGRERNQEVNGKMQRKLEWQVRNPRI